MQWKTGKPFTGYLPETIKSLNKAAAGEEFGGLKGSAPEAQRHQTRHARSGLAVAAGRQGDAEIDGSS